MGSLWLAYCALQLLIAPPFAAIERTLLALICTTTFHDMVLRV